MTTGTKRIKSDLQSVDQVTAALDIFAAARSPLSLKEFVDQIDLSRTSAFRLLTSLEQHGLLKREVRTNEYSLGPKVFLLAERYLRQLDAHGAARPALEWLWDTTGFTVHLSVLDRTEVIYVDKIDGTLPIQVHTYIGGRAPAYTVSAGLAQLAYLEKPILDRHLPGELSAFTPNTTDTRDLLEKRRQEIRALGYSLNIGGWRSAVGGISAPVFRYDRRVVASIGVVLPSAEMGEEVIAATVPNVLRAAAKASQALGLDSGWPADQEE